MSGISGLTGLSGISGRTGISGLTGLSGVQGISGLTGLSGVQGISGNSPVRWTGNIGNAAANYFIKVATLKSVTDGGYPTAMGIRGKIGQWNGNSGIIDCFIQVRDGYAVCGSYLGTITTIDFRVYREADATFSLYLFFPLYSYVVWDFELVGGTTNDGVTLLTPTTTNTTTFPGGAVQTVSVLAALSLNIKNAGQVGIGFNAPLAPLHIFKNGINGNLGGEIRVCAGAEGVARVGCYEGEAGDTWGAWFQYNGYQAGNGTDLIQIGTKRNTVDSTLVNIDANNGNVGLGLTNPTYKLDVVGQFRASVDTAGGIIVNSTNSSPAEVYFDARTNGGSNQHAAVGMSPVTARDFFIWINGADRVNISENGFMEVSGNIRQSSLPVLSVYKSGGTQTVFLNSGTGTVVSFDGTIYNTQWALTSTSRFTLTGPSGYYLIYTRLQTPGAGTTLYLGVAIRVNGVDRAIPYTGKTQATAHVSAQSQVVTFLNTNEYIEVWGIPSNSINVESSTSSDARTSLQVYYLSGK